ncbi:MAG: ribonuclease P protein component [Bacteroidales bacterium]|nr:ribonuclease P protein component [Bacteroidales bacterium]
MVKEFSLSKNERLSSRKSISSLFETGRSIYAPPLRIIYKLEAEDPHALAMAVSVPKRLFKRAVDRNLLKRRIREAYRLNKSDLYKTLEQKELKIKLVIQYQQKEIAGFHAIEEGLLKGMTKLLQKLDEQESN